MSLPCRRVLRGPAGLHTPHKVWALEQEGKRYFGCGSPKADPGVWPQARLSCDLGTSPWGAWRTNHTLELISPSSQQLWAVPRAGDPILGPVTPTSLRTGTGPASKAPRSHVAQKRGKYPRGLDMPDGSNWLGRSHRVGGSALQDRPLEIADADPNPACLCC